MCATGYKWAPRAPIRPKIVGNPTEGSQELYPPPLRKPPSWDKPSVAARGRGRGRNAEPSMRATYTTSTNNRVITLQEGHSQLDGPGMHMSWMEGQDIRATGVDNTLKTAQTEESSTSIAA